MRWSYKTEHFGLKKEGLLGGAFLDEAEIEVTLNEFGRAGWELVSLLEVNDGLMGVFKQPFAAGMAEPTPQIKRSVENEQSSNSLELQSNRVEKEQIAQKQESREEDIGAIKIF